MMNHGRVWIGQEIIRCYWGDDGYMNDSHCPFLCYVNGAIIWYKKQDDAWGRA